jgi:hypothetical protein
MVTNKINSRYRSRTRLEHAALRSIIALPNPTQPLIHDHTLAKRQETPRRRSEDPVNLDPKPGSPDRLHLVPDLLTGGLTFGAEEEIRGSART